MLAIADDVNDVNDVNDEVSCNDWREIDRTLQALAKQRAALDAEEARWLRAAHRVQIWREVGCVSMVDYMERFLGYGVRSAQERLNVAIVLDELPSTTRALETGDLPFTGVRALARVVTPETEQAWLDHCGNMNVHEIEQAVSGHDKGALPTDAKQPELELRVLRYQEIRPSTAALEREALAKARKQLGSNLTDDQFLALVLGAFVEGAGAATDDAGRAKYQVAITRCEGCARGWRDAAGAQIEIDAADLARASCDAQRIGSLDTEQPARATQDIPPRVRRFVWRRDHGKCTLDGCRSAAHLEIHHIIPREDGGPHHASNLTLACDSCHVAIHRGLITVTGTAPDQIVVTRRHAPGAHVRAQSRLDRVTLDVQAKSALVNAGFTKHEAAAAVTAARAHVRADVEVAVLIREALRRVKPDS